MKSFLFNMEEEELVDTTGPISQAVEKVEEDAFTDKNEGLGESSELEEVRTQNKELVETIGANSQAIEKVEADALNDKNEGLGESSDEAKTWKKELVETTSPISQAVEQVEEDAFINNNEDLGESSEDVRTQNRELVETAEANSQTVEKVDADALIDENEDLGESLEDKNQKKELVETTGANPQAVENEEDDFTNVNKGAGESSEEAKTQNIDHGDPDFDKREDDIPDKINADVKPEIHERKSDNVIGESELAHRIDESKDLRHKPQQDDLETSAVKIESCEKVDESIVMKSDSQDDLDGQEYSSDLVEGNLEPKSQDGDADDDACQNELAQEIDESKNHQSTPISLNIDENAGEEINLEPVLDDAKAHGVEASTNKSSTSLDADQETQGVAEKTMTLSNFVKTKSAVVVFSLLRRLTGKIDDTTVENKNELRELATEGPLQPMAMKGRIILYTRLGCQECKEARLFLFYKRLRYVEINIDVYPSRKLELEKISSSTSVPKVFFNEILIGGLNELKALNESGKLDEKIDFLITNAPSFEAPLPPLSGEDDVSSNGALDEMALIVRKMKESIVVKDRFYKMRRFTNCFLGLEAVDFLSEDQYLERPEAVEFARKLASKLFFQHVLEENTFEDGNHLYRFMNDDPIVASQCHNIQRGISTVKPKSIAEIASRLRLLSYAMFEAYVSEDGHHIDYRSMHGSEEFARYMRIVEELQRVDILHMSREQKLAFFINLYNMMTIHAILVMGPPAGALERRKLFADFKYVISGATFSLSAIYNGILRGNQRPPYNLMKPFGPKDKGAQVALPYAEPLVHFALVCGTRSGPALRCYSPGNIDKELMDASRSFLRNGGLIVDSNAKVAYASKILKWFSIDFGKDEAEVMKHVSNYLDPDNSALLLDLLYTSELKVTYQPYDWSLNG